MCKRTIGLVLFALVLGVVGPAWATTKVIIVTNNPGDETEYTPFLQNLLGGGVIVEEEDDKYIDPLSASAKAALISADLIIVSRRTSSGKFVADIPFWNGLAVPMLVHSSFLIGDDRWRWMPGGTQNVDVTQVGVVAPDDLIFDGVTVTDGLVEISSTPLPGLDVSNQGPDGKLRNTRYTSARMSKSSPTRSCPLEPRRSRSTVPCLSIWAQHTTGVSMKRMTSRYLGCGQATSGASRPQST